MGSPSQQRLPPCPPQWAGPSPQKACHSASCLPHRPCGREAVGGGGAGRGPRSWGQRGQGRKGGTGGTGWAPSRVRKARSREAGSHTATHSHSQRTLSLPGFCRQRGPFSRQGPVLPWSQGGPYGSDGSGSSSGSNGVSSPGPAQAAAAPHPSPLLLRGGEEEKEEGGREGGEGGGQREGGREEGKMLKS